MRGVDGSTDLSPLLKRVQQRAERGGKELGLWKNHAAGSLWAHLIATQPSAGFADCENNDASERKEKTELVRYILDEWM